MDLTIAIAFCVGLGLGGLIINLIDRKGKKILAKEKADVVQVAQYWKDRVNKIEQKLIERVEGKKG